MMTEEDGWVKHGEEAMEREFGQDAVWKKLNEAMRVLKLVYYEQVLEHYEAMKKDREEALELLMRVKLLYAYTLVSPLTVANVLYSTCGAAKDKEMPQDSAVPDSGQVDNRANFRKA